MNRWTVAWSKTAENELARLWMIAGDRQAIADVANAIDRHLASDPNRQGDAVFEELRELHVPPLHVLYTVSEDDRMIKVVTVKRDPPESNGLVQSNH